MALSSLEKAKQWQLAVQLLNSMRLQSLQPDLFLGKVSSGARWKAPQRKARAWDSRAWEMEDRDELIISFFTEQMWQMIYSILNDELDLMKNILQRLKSVLHKRPHLGPW